MNTRSGRVNFTNFRILLDSGSSSAIVMVKLMSKLKEKNQQKQLRGKLKQGILRPQRR